MKNRKVLIYGIAILITMLILVISFAFAFLGANKNLVNNLPVNITFADGVAANFTVEGNTNLTINVPGSNMLMDSTNKIAASNSTSITVSLQSSLNVTCTYAVTWYWLSGSDTYEKSITNENEFVISGNDGSTQFLGEINVPYSIENSMVLGRYKITANNSTTTQNWTFTSRFYNLNVNQDLHENKNYQGQIVIENAHCYETSTPTLASQIISNAGSSSTNTGTDPQGNKWYLYSITHTSNNKTEYRYAGASPNNWIEFNGEMWRIIGVMPTSYDSDADTIAETETNLVKIIRNTHFNGVAPTDYKQTGVGSAGSTSGSNAWSDSQSMIMLNPSTFYTTGHNANGKLPYVDYIRGEYIYDKKSGVAIYRNPASLWNTGTYTVYRPALVTTSAGYSSTNTFTKCSGSTKTNCFMPFDSDSQGMVATVKWNLGGISSLTVAAETAYSWENGVTVYNSSTYPRPTFWYGKVGLPYVSDFAFSEGGSNDGTTYSRANCLATSMSSDSGNYRTYCGLMSFIVYHNASGTSKGSATSVASMTPYSTNTNYLGLIHSGGYSTNTYANSSYYNRPVLYLNPDTVYISGDGSYDNPYRFL